MVPEKGRETVVVVVVVVWFSVINTVIIKMRDLLLRTM